MLVAVIRIPVVLRRGLLARARRGIAVAGCRDGRAGVGLPFFSSMTDGRASGVLARKGIFVSFFSSIRTAFVSFYTDGSVEASVMSLKFSIIVEIKKFIMTINGNNN